MKSIITKLINGIKALDLFVDEKKKDRNIVSDLSFALVKNDILAAKIIAPHAFYRNRGFELTCKDASFVFGFDPSQGKWIKSSDEDKDELDETEGVLADVIDGRLRQAPGMIMSFERKHYEQPNSRC